MPEYLDLIKDATTTVGTGAVTPTGAAIAGFRPLSTHTTNASVTYRIANDTLTEWEVGSGIWNGTVLSRLNVHASSNANILVSFSAGSKTINTVLGAADFSAVTLAPFLLIGA